MSVTTPVHSSHTTQKQGDGTVQKFITTSRTGSGMSVTTVNSNSKHNGATSVTEETNTMASHNCANIMNTSETAVIISLCFVLKYIHVPC